MGHLEKKVFEEREKQEKKLEALQKFLNRNDSNCVGEIVGTSFWHRCCGRRMIKIKDTQYFESSNGKRVRTNRLLFGHRFYCLVRI